MPIWQGGRTEGDIERTDAVLVQRNAWLDVQAAASQVEVGQRNREVTQDNLQLTRQRYEAGVTDNIGVVQ